ncbi:MAG: phosphodiesterase [Clostridia bacterium]|nr:phosphodiesterase [Clostridia bacterium]
MKYLIASDIHGSEFYLKKVLKAFEEENADRLILLGDIYYHGPRNPLPEGYNPKGVSSLLNGVKDKLMVIKGNCDAVVDTYISEFEFFPHLALAVNGKSLFLTHGDIYNKDNLPKGVNGVIYGHFHLGFIERENMLIASPGSVSLPKDDFRGYLTLEDELLTLKTIDGKKVKEERI